MTYEQALAYIHSRNRFGIKLGLDRMRALLTILGAPHRQYPVIHIAGTNGKGSTTALVGAVLKTAGYRVGAFTSPHLSSYCERLAINGAPIPPARLAALVDAVRPVVEEAALDPRIGHPTEFEFGTLLALKYFAEEQVNLAVIEVGMGGRLDATNVLTPLVAGIAHIALDHQEYLGTDLVSIAREKAGIIKPGIPVVFGPQAPEANAVLEETARSVAAPCYRVGKEIGCRLVRVDLSGTHLELQWQDEPAFPVRVNLYGAHQAANAALAFGLLQIVKAQGFPWSQHHLMAGFAKVTWPGRMEFFPGPPALMLDGAHNPDGVTNLAHGLCQLFPEHRIRLVVGILDNRPVEKMGTILASILGAKLHRVYVTTVPDAKTAPSARLVRCFQGLGVSTVALDDPLTALKTALAELEEDELLVVCGSLYLVGFLRPYILDLFSVASGGKTCGS
ncbi:MAG: bifunctional folylpolyglutamate synthase/dihydrofolate synthase [Firmicutes bacterium]|nr:bifunctional folylpolyglutamate synthase/dihydrofolate synthase [Bacillota bacterium]